MYSKIEVIILGLLHKKSSHGYELNQILKRIPINKVFKISPISIYKGLDRLANKNLIDPHIEKIGKMPERTVYHINKNGIIELKNQIKNLLKKGLPDDFDLYAALLFFDCIDKEDTIKALEAREENIDKRIKNIEKDLKDKQEDMPLPFQSIIQHHSLHYAAELDWTKKTVKKIKNQKKWPKNGGEYVT